MQVYTDPSLAHYFQSVTEASVLWKQLKDDFESTTVLASSLTFKKLVGTRFNESVDINSQIQQFQTNIEDCTEAGLKLEDIIKVMIFLWAMPDSYDTTISAYVATIELKDLTMAKLIPKILDEERRRKGNEEVSVSKITQTKRLPKGPCKKCSRTNHSTEQHWDTKPGSTQKKGQNNRNNGNKERSNQQQNNNGKKQGNGYKKKKQNKGKGKATVNTLQVNTQPVYELDSDNEINVSLYSTREQTENVAWLIDSGATSHITHIFSDFATYQPAKTPGTCSIAGKDMIVEIKGRGTVTFETALVTREKRRITLHNVLYIPDAVTRFFAPSKALHNGCASNVSTKRWTFSQNGKDMLYGHPDHSGLYWIKGTIIRKTDSVAMISSNNYDL